MQQTYFTPDAYREILERAKRLDYIITPFRDFQMPMNRPVLLLRHDLDHSISSAEFVAELEAEFGVYATYFVQVRCPFYNLLSPASRAALRRIADLGHEIGLHYESVRYAESDGERRLKLDLALIEDLSGRICVSASQHIPTENPPFDMSRWVLNEAYAPRFTSAPMDYVSDSLMCWRQATPHELVAARRSFQFLTHPMNWRHAGAHNTKDVLARALEGEKAGLDREYAEIARYYDDLLARRAALDEAFKARHAARAGARST